MRLSKYLVILVSNWRNYMYTFITNIDSTTHDNFIAKEPICNLLQSSSWAKVKDNWQNTIVAVINDKELVASSLVLIKKLPLGFTMMYIPRGPIMDYTNKELVKFYFQELKKWAKKKHCLFITFDPAITYRRFTLEQKDTNDNKETIDIINNIIANKAIYLGKTLKIEETIQPRFHMGLDKVDDLKSYFPSSTIKSCNTALKRHVKVEIAPKEKLDDFVKMIEMTEKHKNVHLRTKEYFSKIINAYPNDSYIFLASVNPNDYKQDLQQRIMENTAILNNPKSTNNALKKANQTIASTQKELAKLEPLLTKYPSETIIASGLMVGFANEIEMLYAGRNDDFNAFRPQYLLYAYKIHKAFELGYKHVNMGGIEGSLEDGLAKFKSNFNPIVTEYIGQFDLPVMPLLYKLAKTAQKILK